MERVKFTLYKNRVWSIGELKCSDGREWKVNRFWEVDKDWFYIFGESGSSGSGYRAGQIKEKIYIGDFEYSMEYK